jgi:hypothetical protein
LCRAFKDKAGSYFDNDREPACAGWHRVHEVLSELCGRCEGHLYWMATPAWGFRKTNLEELLTLLWLVI